MLKRLSAPLFAFALVSVLSLTYAQAETVQQWHTLELSFDGPQSSETDEVNPFTEYRLLVTFTHQKSETTVRGFYAADGNAAESSADSGNVWKVRFTPEHTGKWSYTASLRKGEYIAIDDSPSAGTNIDLKNSKGSFTVIPSDKSGRDFRAHGRIVSNDGYFQFKGSGKHWIKGGAGSPENLLGYVGFDGTFRQAAEARKGEAATTEELHVFEPHIQDWKAGDPTWQGGKGKGIIGGMNYLAGKGMNSFYFLTLNILGDGKDVWPYTDYEERERFDCSKLDQWEILFQHMQAKGLLLHVVTQETENETLLDEGNTGLHRKLYYRELIARFGHHLALVWNLGEENGPVHWSPVGQSSEQQKAMATYLDASDPYNHPIIIHTHSTIADKDHLLPALLGHQPLDGLSFQIDRREQTHGEVIKWQNKSREAGKKWLITFDEQGKWYRGALPDSVDPRHDTLRHYALWGALLAGSAGVEWYFGAHYEHNDLTLEDWRSRDTLWDQTRHATTFFENYLPYWEMTPSNDLTLRTDDYCFAKEGEIYTIYTPDSTMTDLDLGSSEQVYSVAWYNPITGGELQAGSVEEVEGPGIKNLGHAPEVIDQDWIILVRKKK
ncbi:DUF5060 domain-containing protein [Pelagicoccus mobilis]|uniref:DUF5060 domain-containing protein n=1 Tax=Pelagicoccus mobilis TaxID=415221 RepID=A0A934S0W5_9BACT|nr:DUF5060 domain-containing protein [Pelagicoccus mobilis]MBK1878954.1 DUF5060 domain-containing protein [Pelagicoccus mobilis]